MAKRKNDQGQSTGPYTEQDYVELRAIRDAIARLRPTIESAAACGAKCDEFRQIADETDSHLAQIEQHFMGGFAR